ncbi:MAG: hypothetical protein EOP49_35055, partial [Sphingobacteriales bacterium]
MTELEALLAEEMTRMNWWNRLTGTRPKVASTKGYPGFIQNRELVPETKLRPSTLRKSGGYFLIVLPVFWLGSLFVDMLLKSTFTVFHLAGFTTLLPISIYLFRNSPLNREYFFNLVLNGSGISINNETYPWTQISGTFIITRQEGRYWADYLVIWCKDGA